MQRPSSILPKKSRSKSYSNDKQKFPIHCNIEEILFKSTRNAIEMYEYSPIDSLINLMRSVYDVSEYELLTNYDLFEKSLRQTIPNHVVDAILHYLKEELLY